MCEYPALALLVRKKAAELTPAEHAAIRERLPGLVVRHESIDPKTPNEFREQHRQLKPELVVFFLSKKAEVVGAGAEWKWSNFGLLLTLAEEIPGLLILDEETIEKNLAR